MKSERVSAAMTDEPADSAGEYDVEPSDGAAALRAARMARVSDYEDEALARPDSLEAVLAMTSATLARQAFWLSEAIEREMASGTADVDRLRRLLPAIDVQLRVTRQIDRFAQLEERAGETHRTKLGRFNVDPRAGAKYGGSEYAGRSNVKNVVGAPHRRSLE